jgi:hypothetical protein
VLSAVTQLSPPRDHLSSLCPLNFSLVPGTDDNLLAPICPERISIHSVAASYLPCKLFLIVPHVMTNENITVTMNGGQEDNRKYIEFGVAADHIYQFPLNICQRTLHLNTE